MLRARAPYATVRATNRDTAFELDVVADESGNSALKPLPPGKHRANAYNVTLAPGAAHGCGQRPYHAKPHRINRAGRSTAKDSSETIAGAEMIVFDKCGHVPMVERAAVLNAPLLALPTAGTAAK